MISATSGTYDFVFEDSTMGTKAVLGELCWLLGMIENTYTSAVNGLLLTGSVLSLTLS